MNEQEKLFKDLARRYTEGYGKAMQEERNQLEQNGAAYHTENLERRVMQAVRPRKRRLYIGTIAAIAAILVLVVVGTQLLPFADNPAPSNSAQISSQPSASSSPAGFEVIPLSFAVPAGFTKSGFEQDNEKSVYYFDDTMKDNVVLTMEKSGRAPDPAGMTRLSINGSAAYAVSGEGYSLLTFNKGGVLYELTCQYDINTLTRFGNEIL